MRSICLAVATGLTGASPAVADQVVSFATGRGGSSYYAIGVAMAAELERAAPGVKTSVQSTKGSVENLERLQTRAEIAFVSGELLLEAWRRSAEAGPDAPSRRLRGIAALDSKCIQIVARADSGIRTLDDLRGKRVSVGTANSAIELDARTIFAAAGLSYSSFARVEYFPFGESVELMKDGRLDATLQSAAPGALALRDLANAVNVVVVPVPREVIDRIGNAVYTPAAIPANTYRGQASEVPVAAVRNYLVTRDDLDGDVVYALTKALWSGVDRLTAAHAAARALDRRHALDGMPIPLHPGAEKYYREIRLLPSGSKRHRPVNRARG